MFILLTSQSKKIDIIVFGFLDLQKVSLTTLLYTIHRGACCQQNFIEAFPYFSLNTGLYFALSRFSA